MSENCLPTRIMVDLFEEIREKGGSIESVSGSLFLEIGSFRYCIGSWARIDEALLDAYIHYKIHNGMENATKVERLSKNE